MPDPPSHKLHALAQESAREQRRLLTTLATGALGVFFLALTTEIKPPITHHQRIALLTALLSMGIAVLSGVYAWYCDAQRWYFWAKASEASSGSKKSSDYSSKRSIWTTRLHRFGDLLRVSFVLGILASLAYVGLRALP